MCTVSWVHQPGGYHLLCNRDEKRTRGKAFAPRVAESDGVRYLAPVDSDWGGTWLAANQFGLSLCLLNSEGAAHAAAPRRSRGMLIRELASAPAAAGCIARLRQADLAPFAPFTLAVLEPGTQAVLAMWNGSELTVEPAGDSHLPLTSSSYDAAGVRRSRARKFACRAGAAGRIDAALLYWFHASHGSSPDAYSPCMHRADAETVSFSWVTVTRHAIRYLYSPAAPCRSIPTDQKLLVRTA